MVSTRSSVSVTTNMVSKDNALDQDDENVNKSPDVLKNEVGDKVPPDTDSTLPLPIPELARQAEDLRAHLSLFPNGHRGPSGDRLLAKMELELLKRGTA